MTYTPSSSAFFVVTDGTTVVDLLNPRTGTFGEVKWLPSVPRYKGGGIFRDSPFLDGRRLIGKHFEQIVDTYMFTGAGSSQDSLIVALQQLRRLLEQASDYWTAKWQLAPVWIETKARNETNSRFALVTMGSIPSDADPFQSPFTECDVPVMDSLTLVIEHSLWQATQPATGTPTLIAGYSTYTNSPGNFKSGNVNNSTNAVAPITSNDVYIANKHSFTNIDTVFRADATPTFDANLFNGPFPYNLFKANTIGSATYFGIRFANPDTGMFTNLVLDIGTPSTMTITWEYFSGGVWNSIAMPNNQFQDNTHDTVGTLRNTGVNSISFGTFAGAQRTVINGIDGYWVRARVTALGGTIPTQQNRNPYAIDWPHIEVQASDLGGDAPALIEISLQNRANSYADAAYTYGADRIIVALRSVSRGAAFTPYINFAGVPQNLQAENPSGITALARGVLGITAPVNTSGSGGAFNWIAPGASVLAQAVSITFQSNVVTQYYGRYRVFMRGTCTVNWSNIGLKLTVQNGSGSIELATINIPALTGGANIVQLLDLGILEIPQDVFGADSIGVLTINIYLSTAVAMTMQPFDLVLMPIDEWSAEFINSSPGTTATIAINGNAATYAQTSLDADSIRLPKRLLRALARNNTNVLTGYYEVRSVGPAVLQANSQQRLYFLTSRDYGSGALESLPRNIARVTVTSAQRYLSARGSR